MRVSYWPNGKIQKIRHIIKGVLHNGNGPAKVEFSSLGDKVYEEWCIYGVTHREDGPAVRSWNDFGQQITEEWHYNNSIHRIGGAAIRRWSDSGVQLLEIWAVHGKLHREDGPAYLSTGTAREEVWMRHGVEYREGDLPTEITTKEGATHYKWPMHLVFGSHRVGGPYIIINGEPEWWYKDCKYSLEKYWLLPENRILNAEKTTIIRALPLPIAEEIIEYFWPDGLAKYVDAEEKNKIHF